MDVLSSPLNLAHQQGRRADALEAKMKFQSAVLCHKRASDYLCEAMACTTNDSALESLNLQRESHLRSVRLLHAKILQNQQENGSREDSPELLEENEDSSSVKKTVVAVQKTMEEFDSLLQFLYEQRTDGDKPQMAKPEHETSERKTPTKTDVQVAKKAPKDSKQVIEELQLYSEALRGHLVTMVDEVETKESQLCRLRSENLGLLALLREAEEGRRNVAALARENDELKHRLNRTVHIAAEQEVAGRITSSSYSPVPVGMDLDKLTGMELPPLEMPAFDFDSLSSEK